MGVTLAVIAVGSVAAAVVVAAVAAIATHRKFDDALGALGACLRFE